MNQQATKSSHITTKHDLKKALMMGGADETGHIGFGPIESPNEIPGEFDMDIEAGRRATDAASNPRLSELEALSIEQGRRESMRISDKFDEMQFSPLRTPTKGDMLNPFNSNEVPLMDDDYGAGLMMPDAMNPDPMDGIQPMMPLSPVAEQLHALASSPVAKKTPRPRRQHKGVLALDNDTEISNNELQAQIRNTADICGQDTKDAAQASEFTKPKSYMDMANVATDLNAARFGALFKLPRRTGAPSTPAKLTGAENVLSPTAEPNYQIGMDDDYGFVNAPTEEEMTLLHAQGEDENHVPDMSHDNQQAGMQSPVKRHSLTPIQSPNQAAVFSRSTLETLEVWKSTFASAKGKTLSLESDLMVAMAANGPISRSVAASAFFEALVLCGKGLIKVHQDRAFAPITVRARDDLFTSAFVE